MSGGDDGLSTHLLDEHFLLDTLMYTSLIKAASLRALVLSFLSPPSSFDMPFSQVSLVFKGSLCQLLTASSALGAQRRYTSGALLLMRLRGQQVEPMK
jgi:hypothetical protein